MKQNLSGLKWLNIQMLEVSQLLVRKCNDILEETLVSRKLSYIMDIQQLLK